MRHKLSCDAYDSGWVVAKPTSAHAIPVLICQKLWSAPRLHECLEYKCPIVAQLQLQLIHHNSVSYSTDRSLLAQHSLRKLTAVRWPTAAVPGFDGHPRRVSMKHPASWPISGNKCDRRSKDGLFRSNCSWRLQNKQN